MSREIEVDRFKARSDSGREYTVITYQTFISAASHDFVKAEIPATKRLVTSTGLTVNYIDSKTFKVIDTDEIIRKV